MSTVVLYHNQIILRTLKERDVALAELWAILMGLKMAWTTGCKKVILESDSKEAIDLLLKDPDEAHRDFEVIKQAQLLYNSEWE